jgi:DNA-binding NarL/FixJ family response regulator
LASQIANWQKTPNLSADRRFAVEVEVFAAQFPSSGPIRVLVVDSSRVNSQAISEVLTHQGFQVVYAGPNAREALTVAKGEQVDVALVSRDLGSQNTSGYELTTKLHSAVQKLAVVVVLETPDRDSTINAFRAGARGVFCRTSSLDMLTKCIVCVSEGQVWASSEDLEHLIAALQMPLRLVNASGLDLLSKRECDVVKWAVEGLSNREIAIRLELSENTVKNYLFRIFEKLGISNRVELILYAVNQLVNASHGSNQDGSKTFENEKNLFRWCRQAAERFIVVQHALGEMYRDGRGVSRDREAAYTWFCIAEQLAAGAEHTIRSAKQDLEQELQANQIEDASARAAEWMERQTQFVPAVPPLPLAIPELASAEACSPENIQSEEKL